MLISYDLQNRKINIEDIVLPPPLPSIGEVSGLAQWPSDIYTKSLFGQIIDKHTKLYWTIYMLFLALDNNVAKQVHPGT